MTQPKSVDRDRGSVLIPVEVARDEEHWRRVAAEYQMSMPVTNLENGHWGVMARPVMKAYMANTERVNTEGAYYIRNAYVKDLEIARERVAAALGADVTEVALTRGATESMQALIGGYNRLRPGDAVLYSDLDYPSMQYAMNWLAARRGVRIARLVVPEPATQQNVLEAYAAALDQNRDVQMMLLTHCSHKTGLVLPVRQIVGMGRARNVDVLIDAAHSLGQFEFTVDDLDADFAGFSLQKWIAGPVGLGAVYIRKDRLAEIDPMMGNQDHPETSVLSRVHSGTSNFAAFLTIPAALDFHEKIGPANKAARLRYLRDRWVAGVRPLSAVQILTPDDPDMVAGITSFRLHAGTSGEHNQQIVETLRDRYGLLTAHRTGIARGDCVRITPNLYNTASDLDRLAAAIKDLAGQ